MLHLHHLCKGLSPLPGVPQFIYNMTILQKRNYINTITIHIYVYTIHVKNGHGLHICTNVHDARVCMCAVSVYMCVHEINSVPGTE